MDSLYQRLKELDSDTFQKLCFHLLKEKYPGANIRSVDGSAGDEGIDMFLGDLAGGLMIWQVKAFPNGVREPQKEQIRDSLKTARKLKPKKWILCISVDMDIKAHRWFQYIKKVEAANTGIELDLMQGSDMVHELMFRRTLRNHYFGNAVLDPVEVKRILRQSDKLSDEELESLTEDNVEDFIERLKERDPRFNYEVVFSGDRGPEETSAESRPGHVFSVKDSTKTINAFARDIEALKQDPLEVQLTLKDAGIEKIMSLIRTGMSQEFTAEEIVKLRTNLRFPGSLEKPAKIVAGPSPMLTNKRLRTRLTFQMGTDKVIYNYVEFRPSRGGSEEVEWVTASEKFPFEIRILIPKKRSAAAALNYREKYEGAEIHDVSKSRHAFGLLLKGCEIELFDLDNDAVIIRSQLTLTAPPEVAGPESYRLIDDLVMISDRFKVKLFFPKEIAEKDWQSVSFLISLIKGGTASWDAIPLILHKTESNCTHFPLSETESSYRLTIPQVTPMPKLFGVEIDTGPYVICIDRARIKDFAETTKRFNEAEVGMDVPIILEPLCSVRLMLLDNVMK